MYRFLKIVTFLKNIKDDIVLSFQYQEITRIHIRPQNITPVYYTSSIKYKRKFVNSMIKNMEYKLSKKSSRR
jgi:hypothetical protein